MLKHNRPWRCCGCVKVEYLLLLGITIVYWLSVRQPSPMKLYTTSEKMAVDPTVSATTTPSPVSLPSMEVIESPVPSTQPSLSPIPYSPLKGGRVKVLWKDPASKFYCDPSTYEMTKVSVSVIEVKRSIVFGLRCNNSCHQVSNRLEIPLPRTSLFVGGIGGSGTRAVQAFISKFGW